jgi:predicted RND superfamily exporter protein
MGESFVDPVMQRVVRHRLAIAIAFLVLAAAALPGALRLSSDNTPAVFFPVGTAAQDRLHAFEKAFGSDEGLRLVFEGTALWTPEALAFVAAAESQASHLPSVRRVAVVVGDERDPEALRARLEGSLLARNLGQLARDGSALTVPISTEKLTPESSRALLDALTPILARAPPGLSASAAGGPVINRALDRSSEEVGRRHFPVLVLLASALLLTVFRDLAGVVVPLLFVAVVEAVLLGVMGLAGARMNLVLAVLPPLLFVITLATSIHLVVRFRDLRAGGMSANEAVVSTWHECGWAVFWAGVTQIIGFGSLITSSVRPVRDLGAWAAAGILFMTLAAFTALPALLALLGGSQRAVTLRGEEAGRRFGLFVSDWAMRRRKFVLTLTALVAVLSLLGLPRLTVESNVLRYFRPDHPVRAQVERLERQGIGTATVELVVRRTDGATVKDVPTLVGLAAVTRALREDPAVEGVVSAGDMLEEAVQRARRLLPIPDEGLRLIAIKRLPHGEQGDTFTSFFADSDRATHVTLFVRQIGYHELDALTARLRVAAARGLPGASVEVTGEYPLLLEMQRVLLQTLGWSLLTALPLVYVIFWVLTRSAWMGVLALIPNAWPVLLQLGVMGWLHVPLDVASVMVASIVTGIVMDDTLHSLGHFREFLRDRGPALAIRETLQRTAGAFVLTGGILVVGFGTCALSSFAPTQRFGGLSALALAVAAMADLVMVPALLARLPARVARRVAARRSP